MIALITCINVSKFMEKIFDVELKNITYNRKKTIAQKKRLIN
jgi:hypothetical protein